MKGNNTEKWLTVLFVVFFLLGVALPNFSAYWVFLLPMFGYVAFLILAVAYGIWRRATGMRRYLFAETNQEDGDDLSTAT